MTKDKFKNGDEVEIRVIPIGLIGVGKVVGYTKAGLYSVLEEGHKSPYSYAASSLKLIPKVSRADKVDPLV